MQPRRCTQGLCIIGFLLFSGAFVLDDMALLLAGGTLSSGILGLYLMFENQTREIARSIQLKRTLNRNPVRKGMVVQVSTTIKIRVPARMKVDITDLLPTQTTLIEGNTTITAGSNQSAQTLSLKYRLIPMVHGMQPFSGISVHTRNTFFEETIRFNRDSTHGDTDREPVISVLSSGMFVPASLDYHTGTLESRKVSIWSGTDVHSLREYIVGDDLRHVDWKISAKYNKLVIRKYAGVLSYPPLIIVDLPEKDTAYSENEFSRMVTEVFGIVTHTIEQFQHVSVLFISGPNIIHMIREERNVSRCVLDLREWMHPSERPVHYYRMLDRSDLRSQVRIIENTALATTNPRIQEYHELLHKRYLEVLQYQRNPAFTGQAMRAISRLLITDAYLFSVGYGDISHIRHLIRALRVQSIPVHLRIMNGARPGKSAQNPSAVLDHLPLIREAKS